MWILAVHSGSSFKTNCVLQLASTESRRATKLFLGIVHIILCFRDAHFWVQLCARQGMTSLLFAITKITSFLMQSQIPYTLILGCV